jgi:prolyl 4-hydroxylase
MSSKTPYQIRWRTFLEVAVISVIIYFLVGAPGLSKPRNVSISNKDTTPIPRAKVESLVHPTVGLRCLEHKYDVHVFSASPLLIYVDGFLSKEEANHLLSARYGQPATSILPLMCASANKWQVSTVFNEGVEITDESVRKSEKALLDRDEVVQCIEQRALSFQGWPQDTFVERLWTQRYNVTGHYDYHYDWATASKTSRRVSTFMVYVHADCAGGGTHFPRMKRPHDEKWCRFVDCENGVDGVIFRPRKGAAVFWTNFDADGRGYKETIHAGMPVTGGTKVGLNIWSWYQAGYQPEH